MPKFQDFLAELKARSVRKTMAIYVGSALTFIGIIKLFVETYSLPTMFMPIVVTLLTCGLASAFVVAWFHGKEGAQKFSRKEILLHCVIVAIALVISFRIEPSRLPKGANTIAVLPFKNMSDNKEDEYFSDGITEDILTQLSKIGDLNVISRSSVMKFKETEKTIREISTELGAGTIFAGSVRRVGSRVRIDGKLSDGGNEAIIWADTYDREYKDIFTIQTEVATIIARELKAKLSPQEEKLLQKQPTRNLDAYDYYLNGRNYYYRLTKDNNEQAIVLFKKAIALDSSYALACAGLADAYAQRFQRYGFDESWADTSIALSLRAVELDPNIAEPYKSLGLAYYQKEWYQRAMEQYRKALALNPNFASVYANMGELLDWTGHQDEALPLILKSLRLQPGRASDFMKLGSVYFSLGMLDRAAEMFKKAIELNPAMTAPHVNLAEINQVKGDFRAARLQLDSIRSKNPDDPHVLFASGNIELYDRKYDKAYGLYRQLFELSPSVPGLTTALGFVLQKLGKKKEGDDLLEQSIAINQRQIEALSEEGSRRYDLARAYAVRGDTTEALQWLRDAIERGSGIVGFIDNDPLLESLRRNAEYQRLMTNLKSHIEAMRTRVLAMRRRANNCARLMLAALFLGIVIGFALCIAPGPIAVAFMKQAVVGRYRHAIMIGVGAAMMDVVFNLVASFASSAIVVTLRNLFLHNRWLSLVFQLLCVVVLLVLGIRYFRQKHNIAEERHVMEQEASQEERAKQYSRGSPFFLGVMLAVTNLATPTFFPSMVAAVSYLHAEGFLGQAVGTNIFYAVGFGLGTLLWFVVLLRFFMKHRTKLSPGFINTMFKFAGVTFLVFAVLLIYNVAMTTHWNELFAQ